MNSSLSQPETMFTAARPLEMWSAVMMIFRQHAGVPHARVDGGNHFEPLGGGQQGEAEGGGLVLLVRAVGSGVAGLGEGVFEAGVLGDPGQFLVVVEVPAGALFDGGNHQAAGNIGNPVGELERFGKTGDVADVSHECSFTSGCGRAARQVAAVVRAGHPGCRRWTVRSGGRWCRPASVPSNSWVSSRRMILPLRVLGTSGTTTTSRGLAIGPIAFATWLPVRRQCRAA